MKSRSDFLVAILVAAFLPASALAQSTASSHPALSSKFYVSAGAFFPDKNFKIRVDGTVPGEEIDFEEALKVDDSETTWSLVFDWRFGEKWSLSGQYWEISDSATAVLEEDIEWEDVVFQEGTFASTGIGLKVARVFFGRKFSTGPRHEFGAGAGFHWLELDAYLEGQILTSEGNLERRRESVEYDFPLPNIGAWYTYSWSPKWALMTRVDWLSASVGDYSGGLWNARLGINWAIWEHFGLSAAWNFFELEGDVDKSDWRGKVESEQNGPYIALSVTW